jgi:dTDP-4-dehydrorhamnose reductase
MKKIFVVGGSSFIGKRLGVTIAAEFLLKTFQKNQFANGVFFDLANSSVKSTINKDDFSHILLLSGIVRFDVINKDPLKARHINVLCIKRIIDEAIELGLTVVYFSSESVFDGVKGNYYETDMPNALFEYARQKVEIENYIISKTDNYLIVRLSKVFSSDITDNTLVSQWLRQLDNNMPVICAYDNIFSPIHIDDLVFLIEKLVSSNARGIYHLSSEQSLSRKEMFDLVLQEYSQYRQYTGKTDQKSLHEFSGAENYPLNTSMNPFKVVSTTNFHPRNFPFWAKLLTKEFCTR